MLIVAPVHNPHTVFFPDTLILIHMVVHIPPHHGNPVIFFQYLLHPVQMLFQQNRIGSVVVLIQVFPPANPYRLIIADMNTLCSKGLRTAPDSLLNKFVGLLLPYQQRIRTVIDRAGPGPLQRMSQVGGSLYAADQFDSQVKGITVYLPDFLPGKPASHIAKVRQAGDLIGILCVQHHHVQAHTGQNFQHFFRTGYRRHRISGTVNHNSVHGKIAVLISVCLLTSSISR